MVKMSVLGELFLAKPSRKLSTLRRPVGKRQVLLRPIRSEPISKVIVKFLRVMQQHDTATSINEFEIIDDARAGKIVVWTPKSLDMKIGSLSSMVD